MGEFQFFIEVYNRFDAAGFSGWEYDNFITFMHHARGHCATETPEIEIRTIYVLDREAEIGIISVIGNFHGLKN